MAGSYLKRRIRQIAQAIGTSVLSIPYNIRRAYNKKRIKSRDFTVISNNCWAGKLYQYMDMPYLSPTVGLYFFADDYIRFVQNFEHYISMDLKFISYKDSRYKNILLKKNETDKPIGILDDVEIVFLHYKTQEEAYEKWNRRKNRINWDNIIFKFSKMNKCKEYHLAAFDALPYNRKFMLTPNKEQKYNCEIYWNGKTDEYGQILLDTIPFPGNIRISRLVKRTINL